MAENTIDHEHEGSPEHVMSRIAAQIMANGNGKGDHGRRVFASPLARRIASERGIDLAALKGSGPHGRIVLRDVEHAAPESPAAPTENAEAAEAPSQGEPTHDTPSRGEVMRAPAPSQGLSDKQVLAMYEPGSYELVPHDTMRRLIAERLTLAKQTIPHFYLNIECQLDALLAARKRLNDMAPDNGPRMFKLSLNDFIIKAMAMRCRPCPAPTPRGPNRASCGTAPRTSPWPWRSKAAACTRR
ncbi:hypothetical protein AUC71_15830 [Methyloceanibacter marginalis]|uniref:Peripheral subunit-binding (PSBD) domain-containing protein n=1 Tax=Methyloceanibacter marginalis TaxID=1774971 RepID=A0A1E3W952_9HYPH|nr:E3 binding domain-containing protein [Methyloceanibacter marginalis]ODS02344.1 hypothetical protein AUC71_15830 [Methyloceanibacter marginalis]